MLYFCLDRHKTVIVSQWKNCRDYEVLIGGIPSFVCTNISRVWEKATCRNCISQSLDFTDLLVLHADTFLLLRSTLTDKMTDIALTIPAYGKTC